MPQQTFECEVLTPLFLGGSEARGTPELRAPSLRGAMRYWYRALLGGTQASSLESLHQFESALFGKAEEGGALVTRLQLAEKQQTQAYEKDHAIRTPKGDFLPTGKDYLLWSMSSTGKPGTPRFQPSRQYIEPGSHFKFTLSAKLDSTVIQKGEAAFWLLANLGAVGARSNRGAGSFQAIGNGLANSFTIASSVEELQGYLHLGLARCLEQVGRTWRSFLKDEQAEFDTLHPGFCDIFIVAETPTGWSDYRSALNGLGNRFRDFRTHLNPKGIGKSEHDAVLRWLERGGKGPQLKRPVFGLPIPFRYSQGGPSDVILHADGDRRGSPLHIRVTRLSNGNYVGVLTLFKSRFLPDKTDLKLQERKWTAPPPPDFTVIQDFIRTFPVHEGVTL